MVIYGDKTHAYYPISKKGPDLICGSKRIRFVRGGLLVNPRRSGTTRTAANRPG